MFTIQTTPCGDHVMIISQILIDPANEEKAKKILKELTKMPVGEQWVLQHAEKMTTKKEKINGK